MIFGQTRRNPPSCFLSEIEPDLLDETESPELAYSGGFGAGYGSYGAHLPGGRSGYSGGSRGYLNSDYNAGFGSRYGGRSGFAASGGNESPNRPGTARSLPSAGLLARGTGLPRAAGGRLLHAAGQYGAGQKGKGRRFPARGSCRSQGLWPGQGAQSHAGGRGLHCRDPVRPCRRQKDDGELRPADKTDPGIKGRMTRCWSI